MKISTAQHRALSRAAKSKDGCVCPLWPGLGGGAATSLIKALRHKGLITHESCPRITQAGRAALTTGTDVRTP